MNLPPPSSVRTLDAVVAGLSVVDVIGRPVNLRKPPKPGGLQSIDSITMTTGGNVPNVGIDLAKLGFRVGAVTRVGNDTFGGFLRSQLEMHGITSAGLVLDDTRQTSSTIVGVDRNGERTFFHTRGCMENFRVEDLLAHIDVVRRGRILVFGYYGLLPECDSHLGRLFRAVHVKTGIPVLLDTAGSPRRDERMLRSFLPHVDYFIPSYDEAAVITGETAPARIVAALMDAGAPGVVGVKLGAEGCYISWRGKAKRIPARKVRRVVDATGAGDAFVSGFVAGLLRGADPFLAAKLGNAVAASSLSAVGASTAIRPVEEYLRV
jgi:sugar/nucleoside kinase (ribokinase family)